MNRTFGTSLPTDGPGLSAFISCMLLPPTSGRTASRNTRMPMPPIQWEKQRHILVQWLSSSTLSTTLAPVVVKPETISNIASTKDGISPVSMNGTQPNALIKIQPSAVQTKPSLA